MKLWRKFHSEHSLEWVLGREQQCSPFSRSEIYECELLKPNLER
jgi:hypothetical protein